MPIHNAAANERLQLTVASGAYLVFSFAAKRFGPPAVAAVVGAPVLVGCASYLFTASSIFSMGLSAFNQDKAHANELQTAQTQYDEIKVRKDAFELQLKDKQRSITRLTEDKQKITETLNALQQAVNRLRAENPALEQKCFTLESEINALKVEVNKLAIVQQPTIPTPVLNLLG